MPENEMMGGWDYPTAQANTGQNDAGSVWGTGWLQPVVGLGNTAANIISALRGNNNTAATPSASQVAAQTAQQQNTMKLIVWGGLALAGVVLLVALFKK